MIFILWLNDATFRNFKNRKKRLKAWSFKCGFYQPLVEERDFGEALSPRGISIAGCD